MKNRLIRISVLLLLVVIICGVLGVIFPDHIKLLKWFGKLNVLAPIVTGLLLVINAVFLYSMQLDKNDKDTFQAAIQNLGHDSESVRLGGIYALYGLADKSRYKKDVHEILCAHIRSKTNEKAYKTVHKNEPSTEIQALLGLLSSKPKNQVFATDDKPIQVNLRGAFLQGANLDDAQLQSAGLQNTQLQGAKFQRAQLQDANLWGAQLQGANLWGAQLQGANLQDAQLRDAKLWNAQLQGANLYDAQLQGADLLNAQLQGAFLWRAQLQGANLCGVQLQGAELRGAQLQGANLQDAQLQGAELRGAQLQGVYSTEEASTKLDYHIMSFAERINTRVDKETNLDNTVVLKGGMRTKDLTRIKRIIDLKAIYWTGHLVIIKEHLETLLQKIEDNHVNKRKTTGADKEKAGQYLKDAQTGSYTAEEAEKWITEYDEAMNSSK